MNFSLWREFFHRPGASLLFQIAESHSSTVFEKGLNTGPADALGASGYDCLFTFQSAHGNLLDLRSGWNPEGLGMGLQDRF